MQFTQPVLGNAEDGQRYAEGCFVGVDNHRVCICIPVAGSTFIALHVYSHLLYSSYETRKECTSRKQQVRATSSGKKLMLWWFSIAIILLFDSIFLVASLEYEFQVDFAARKRGYIWLAVGLNAFSESICVELVWIQVEEEEEETWKWKRERAHVWIRFMKDACDFRILIDDSYERTLRLLMFEKGFQIKCNFLNNYRIRKKYFYLCKVWRSK